MTTANSTFSNSSSSTPQAQHVIVQVENLIDQTVLVVLVSLACLFVIFGIGKNLYEYLKMICEKERADDVQLNYNIHLRANDFDL